MTSRVWVTGAYGFLGRHLSRRFAASGWSVAGLGRGIWSASESAEWGNQRWLAGDITLEMLFKLRELHGIPDVLIHAAGGSSVGRSLEDPRRDFMSSVNSTAEVLAFLRLYAPECRLVLISSAAVYGMQEATPIAETTATAPLSPYGLNKCLAEQLCMTEAGGGMADCLTLRLFSLYGPGLRKQLLWDIANKLSTGAREIVLRGTGDETRDMVQVEDVAELVLTAACSRVRGFLNIGSGRAMSVREIAEITIGAFGHPAKLVFNAQPTPSDPPHQCADVTLLKRLAEPCRCKFSHGVIEYANWFRSL